MQTLYPKNVQTILNYSNFKTKHNREVNDTSNWSYITCFVDFDSSNSHRCDAWFISLQCFVPKL